MKSLVFATNNKHKIEEATSILQFTYKVVSLRELNYTGDIPETEATLEGNASIKAWHIFNRFGIDCFADDTGLEVDALDGAPGVYSARYAGPENDFNKNVSKLLDELQDISDRKARFRTIVSLIINGRETQFEGIINGTITTERFGHNGFGYDPVFIPDGYSQTIAELDPDIKNKISHRAIALHKMADFLGL